MRTSNPALNNAVFAPYLGLAQSPSSAMTIQGAAWKTSVLLGLATGMAFITYGQLLTNPQLAIGLAVGGGIGALIVGFITAFSPRMAPVTAPLYALFEGCVLGAISGIFEAKVPGIAIQAIFGTFGTLFGLLLAYQSGIIRATENFKLGVFAATMGIGMIYLVSWIGGMVGFHIPYIHGSGLIGIGFSAVVVIIAAFNLVLDFDYIEQAAARGAPKSMEWYAAYGLMVTLVWLYIEVLQLLMKIAYYTSGSSRDD